MADPSLIIEGVKGAKELYEWLKKRKGKVFRVLVNGKEKIIRIKDIPEPFGGHFVLAEDLMANEEPMFLKIKSIIRE